MNTIFFLLERLLSRPFFYRLNKFLYFLSLKGLGVNNSSPIIDKGDFLILDHCLKHKKSPIVFDVGANIGKFATKVLEVNKSSNIYAFEPHPKTFRVLAECASTHMFNAINKGCGDTEEVLEFYDYANNDGSEHASLLRKVFDSMYKAPMSIHKVQVIKLDNYMRQNNIDFIDFLKIDTEGYEYNVLKGCIDAIKADKIKAIYFEFNTMNIVNKVFMRDFVEILPKFQFFRILQNGLIKIDTNQILLSEIFGFQNILALLNQEILSDSKDKVGKT